MAREVLDVQRYPDLRQYPGGPPERPYDAAGWTLPLQMGVNVVAGDVAARRRSARAKMKPLGPAPDVKVEADALQRRARRDAAPFDSVPGLGFDTDPAAAAIVPPAGRVTGSGPLLASIRRRTTPIARSTARGRAARRESSSPAAATSSSRPGRGAAERAREVAGADRGAHASPPAPPCRKPRIGLFQPWSGSMDEGWTRWVLEQYGFDVRDAASCRLQVAARRASRRGDPGRRCAAANRGSGRRPRPRRPGAAAGRQVRPEYADRLTPDDLGAFEQFIRGGGTLVCLNTASNFAIQQFKLPVKNVVAGLRPEEFFLDGTIVEVTTDPAQQVMAGMPEQAAVFADGSPVFETQEGFKGRCSRSTEDVGLAAPVRDT